MDDVRDDVIITCPFKTDPRIFHVWHKYFDATFVIVACILILTGLVIYVAHRYRRTRVCVEIRTIVFYDSSDVPLNTEECCIYLCNFVVGDQLASNYSCKHVYHRWCITRALAWALTYPFCWDVDSDGDYWVWHPDDGVRILSFGFFFFFLL